MLTRSWPLMIALLAIVAPFVGYAQVVEEDETEVMQPMPRGKEPTEHPDLGDVVKRVLVLTNGFREEEKREPLEVNDELRIAAQYFADYMARTSRFGRKADGQTPADRAKKYGYEYCIVAENLADGYNSEGFTTDELAREFVDGWKASPGHRRNMLDPDVTETAVAVAEGKMSGYFFAVQMFGRPRSMAMEFTIANESDTVLEYKMGERRLTLAPGHARTHQVCRQSDLAFRWIDAEGEKRLVEAVSGDRFVVTQDGENLSLHKE